VLRDEIVRLPDVAGFFRRAMLQNFSTRAMLLTLHLHEAAAFGSGNFRNRDWRRTSLIEELLGFSEAGDN
jgi:hypothetical protein